ncbi:MAG: glycosyltransferase family 4 protein [Colwellia sp.]|nr:glycosyltransferase family 4 protein [Colwellia sp.]
MTVHLLPHHITRNRILYVHYGDNWLRGSEIVLLDLLKKAKENQYSPILWCNSEILATKAMTLGVEVILHNFVCLGYWTKPRWSFRAFFQQLIKAKKIIQQYNISIVHCNNGAPCQWMMPVCKLTDVPLVLHLHARYMFRDRLTLLFHGADRIVGVSQSVISLFNDNEFQAKQLQVIYNGIDPQRVISNTPRDIRAEVCAKKTDFVILYMGSLIPRKAVDKLIHALDKLKDNYAIKLTIIGSGSDESKLRSLVKELKLSVNVQFFASSDDVGAIYASNVDCFISVPTEEVFGLTLAEASMAKLPIITTNIVGINEIYTDKTNALLVKPNAIDELVEAIKSLIENPFLRKKLALKAHAHIEKSFSLTHQFNIFDCTYQALLLSEHKYSLYQSITQHMILLVKALLNKGYKALRFSWRKSHD